MQNFKKCKKQITKHKNKLIINSLSNMSQEGNLPKKSWSVKLYKGSQERRGSTFRINKPKQNKQEDI